VVKRRKKIRTRSVHPRAFVKKYDLPPRRFPFKQLRQLQECLAPAFQSLDFILPISAERLGEFRKLVLHSVAFRQISLPVFAFNGFDSRMFKGKRIIADLAYQKSLSNTTTPVNRNKFRFVGFKSGLQFYLFVISSYEHLYLLAEQAAI
jgi:hypothetical protein